ncbi:F-box protein CPR1-like [Trifolium pratense]|uniref:F-box protein CPR1-like n=1 Tax=Trifolium pratense TaxID=57577 RepID=UPI001E693F26|nr:F-box protein CPR1-like [Trifolium pratense]
MTKYRNNFLSNTPSYDGDTSLLMNIRCYELYSLSGDRFENKVKLNWPNPFSEGNSRFNICCFGSANGILCLSYNNYGGRRIVLWNPTTEKFKVIPPKFGVSVTLYGFGYDNVADDYKVIRQVKLPTIFHRLNNDILFDKDSFFLHCWEIYSLRSNLWKKLDFNMPNCNTDIVSSLNGHLQVYMNGMCHRVCEYYKGREPFVGNLVSFDLNKETVSVTSIPSHVTLDWTQLTALNGSIALVSSTKKATLFHISILGEIGVKESWIKLFIVEQPCVGFPIGVGMKGEIFIQNIDDEIVWFDLTTKMIKELGLKGKRMEFLSGYPIANVTIIIKNLACTF